MIVHNDTIRAEKPMGYANIDLAKFICALLVIIIHTSPFENASSVAQFYIEDVLARVAVPLFYAITGFLFFRKLTYKNGKIVRSQDNCKKLLRYCKKTAFLYLSWSFTYIVIIFIPLWYRTGYWGVHLFKDCLAIILFKGTYYHLWYLLSLVYAIPLLYGLLCFFDFKKVGTIAIALWICECLTYSYSWVGTEQITLVAFISSRMPIIFDTLFRAVPLLTIGAFISQYQPNWHFLHKRGTALFAFLICAFEASILYFFSPNSGNYSYLFSTPLLTFTCLLLLISTKQHNVAPQSQILLRETSLSIYCLHPMVIEILHLCGVPNGVPIWISVTLFSTGFAAGWSLWKRWLRRKLLRHS